MLEIGQIYYWKRTDGWDWFGTRRWWEVFVTIDGLNGSGGYWLKEHWRWNGDSEDVRTELRTLNPEESQSLQHDIEKAMEATND